MAVSPRAVRGAGYSGTPLVDKLGIKPGSRMHFVGAPPSLPDALGPLPDGAREVARGALDFAMLFVSDRSDLEKRFAKLRDRLVPNGMLWVSWPKKSSGVATNLTEDVVRTVGLAAGVVDVKVCAVDETWSGLKFVRRIRDR
jgi:hypothetical protein